VFFIKFILDSSYTKGEWTCDAILNKFRELDFEFESSWT